MVFVSDEGGLSFVVVIVVFLLVLVIILIIGIVWWKKKKEIWKWIRDFGDFYFMIFVIYRLLICIIYLNWL